jgi:hypothetical protein
LLDRVTINDDGNAVHALRKPDRHGRTKLVVTPDQLMARLSALIPAPRSPLRRRVVPPTALPTTSATGTTTRTPWAQLVKRVFGDDTDSCPRCGGRMVVVAIVQDPKEARRYLEGTGVARIRDVVGSPLLSTPLDAGAKPGRPCLGD